MKTKIDLKNIKVNNKNIILCKKNVKLNIIAIIWKNSNEIGIYDGIMGYRVYKNKYSNHKMAIKILENSEIYKDYVHIK